MLDEDVPQGVGLTKEEAFAFAKYLIAREAATEWLEWEDLPELSEQAFERLAEAVEAEVEAMHNDVKHNDGLLGIDSADLLSRATTRPRFGGSATNPGATHA